MRLFLASLLLAAAGVAQAASVPTNLEFPLKNGAAGEVYKMADHPNSVFVFEAFGLNCPYCNDNAPNLDKLTNDYKSNPRVQVLDLGLDSQASYYVEWIRRHKPNHPVVQDVSRRVFGALSTEGSIPQVFVANCKGALVGKYVGSWDSSAARYVRGLVDKALETVCE